MRNSTLPSDIFQNNSPCGILFNQCLEPISFPKRTFFFWPLNLFFSGERIERIQVKKTEIIYLDSRRFNSLIIISIIVLLSDLMRIKSSLSLSLSIFQSLRCFRMLVYSLHSYRPYLRSLSLD